MAVGRGDEHDARTKARGVTASFSLNGLASGPTCGGVGVGGVGVLVSGGPTENLENSGNPPEPDDQPVDLYRENEELKVNNFLFFLFLVFCLLLLSGHWHKATRFTFFFFSSSSRQKYANC